MKRGKLGYCCVKCGVSICDHYGDRILELEQENKKMREALKYVDNWFERMKKDQHEKLVENQTFESACENWFKLLQEPLDMEIIKEALKTGGGSNAL